MMVREVKDPRVRLASVSACHVSPDLKSARVLITAVGSDQERRDVVAALRKGEKFLRYSLRDRLENLKYIPYLRFELDDSIKYSIHIAEMLKSLDEEPQPETDMDNFESPAIAGRPLAADEEGETGDD